MAPRTPLVFWAASAAVLTAIVLVVVPGPGPLDDPEQGDQRDGVLVDREEARRVPGLDLADGVVGRRPVVVVFDRDLPSAPRFARLRAAVPEGVATVVVVAQARPADRRRLGVPLLADPDGSVAAAVGMPEPGDGGPPVGYAVLDAEAFVRYATLDPTYLQHGFEVDIIAGALT